MRVVGEGPDMHTEVCSPVPDRPHVFAFSSGGAALPMVSPSYQIRSRSL